MIGFRVTPDRVRELSHNNQVTLLQWLERVCGLNVQHVLALDFTMDDLGRVTMDAHVRDAKFTNALGTNVIDVVQFKLRPEHGVPPFIVKQLYEGGLPIPPEGFGDVPVEVLVPQSYLPGKLG
jgi:hypothetical protein